MRVALYCWHWSVFEQTQVTLRCLARLGGLPPADCFVYFPVGPGRFS